MPSSVRQLLQTFIWKKYLFTTKSFICYFPLFYIKNPFSKRVNFDISLTDMNQTVFNLNFPLLLLKRKSGLAEYMKAFSSLVELVWFQQCVSSTHGACIRHATAIIIVIFCVDFPRSSQVKSSRSKKWPLCWHTFSLRFHDDDDDYYYSV